MKKLLNRFTAFVSAAVITAASAAAAMPVIAADEERGNITVTFDIFGEGITPSKKTDIENFKPVTTNATLITIPAGSFDLDGYYFNGWTVDGVYAYLAGDSVLLSDYSNNYTEDVVVKALWTPLVADEYEVKFDVVYEGEELERPEWLKDYPRAANNVISPDMTEIQLDGVFSRGWYCGDLFINYDQRIVMPDHDITLTPHWVHRYNFTFVTGDVDRISGNTEFTTAKVEGVKTELADSDRFSRAGFNLVGWESSYDGLIYTPGQTIIVPSSDVTYTAVWAPKNYTVVFKTGVTSVANVKIKGDTDTAITCPSLEREGYTLTGWKYTDAQKNTTVYAPGQDFVIPGARPGVGISLDAVWEAGEVPVTSTQPAETTTVSATETTTVQSASATAAATTSAKPSSATATATTSAKPSSATATATTTAKPSSATTTAATDEMVECEICHKIVKRSDCVISPIGVLLCTDCKKAGAGGTTAPRPTETETTETTAAVSAVKGDVNGDGQVTIADAVAILQFLANSTKYPLSEQGRKNADVDGADGITATDALTIQKFDAKVITEF